MSTPRSVDLEIQFAVPFDHALFVDVDTLGSVESFSFADRPARLELPGPVQPDSRALSEPASASTAVTKHLEGGYWGIHDESQGFAAVDAALVVVSQGATLHFELPTGQIGGEAVLALTNEVGEWFESLCHWLWALTSQSLDPANPDPKVMHRRSTNMIVTASGEGERSIPASLSPPIKVVLDRNSSSSERVVDGVVLQRAVTNAGRTPSLALELLASARMAARRGNGRRSLVDSGTAAEAALSQLLSLPPSHKMTLGTIVREAVNRGIAVPADTQRALVDPRNDAVHRGRLLPGTDVSRALDVVEQIVRLWDPDVVPVDTLKAVNRPQRHDMVFIRAPQPPDEGAVPS